MHSDDVGDGAAYSATVVSMLHDVIEKSGPRALHLPLERALALHMIAVYSSIPSEQKNALSRALSAFKAMGAAYHVEACERQMQMWRAYNTSKFPQEDSSRSPWRRRVGGWRPSRMPSAKSYFARKFMPSATRPALLDLGCMEARRLVPAVSPAMRTC